MEYGYLSSCVERVGRSCGGGEKGRGGKGGGRKRGWFYEVESGPFVSNEVQEVQENEKFQEIEEIQKIQEVQIHKTAAKGQH